MDPNTRHHRFRILLADDQREVRTSLRRFLERDGRFEVIGEVSDGNAAMSLAAKEQPDAVLLDLAMPGLNGLQALPGIRKVSPGSKVVILSSLIPFDDIGAKALSLGAAAVFDKYTSPKKVIRALAGILAELRAS